MIKEAIEYAVVAHSGQSRKYTGEAYATHPIEVANLVKEALPNVSDEVLVAAYLHDTVEDTWVTIEDIIKEFGEEVAKGVWFLTKPENFVGNRKVRKALDRSRLAQAPDEIKVVKLCDMMHNTFSIYQFDKKFWKTFKAETQLLLEEAGLTEATLKLGTTEFVEERVASWLELIYSE